MALILGIDGGGTHTRALLADDAGKILGYGEAAGSNPRALGWEVATMAIKVARWEALAAAGLPSDTPIDAICLGIAGVGRPEERVELERWAKKVRLAKRRLVVTEIEPIIAAGTPHGWGVALISGTGSSCFAIAPNGEKLQVGGWGYLLGDEGSGYDIALRALRLATQTADGRAAAPALLSAILEEWRLSEPRALVSHVYDGGLGRAEIATLTRPVLALAEAGDADALALLDQAATDLALMAQTAARRLSLIDPPLSLAGGLLTSSIYLRERLQHHLGADRDADWGAVAVVTEPARGALVLAQRLLAKNQQ